MPTPTRKILYLPRTGLSRDILSDRARDLLNGLGHVIWNETDRDLSEDELAELLPGADAVITSWGTPVLTAELLEMADQLRIVGHAAGSVKRLMPVEGYERGIVVLSGAPIIADAVAEFTLWAMLSGQRDLYRYDRFMKQDRGWKTSSEDYGHCLYRKSVGIVAASMVGRRVIRLLAPFGCDILVFDPYLSDADAAALGVRKVTLEQLFSDSDIVSIHAPTTPETKAMIGAPHFQAMRDGTLLINTSRAWVTDQDALLAELQRGRIQAYLDVFDREPLPADHPLRDLENVFLTPHISGHTTETRRWLVEGIAEDMVRFFNGEPLQLAVPYQRLNIMA